MLKDVDVEKMLPDSGLTLSEAIDVYQSFPNYKQKEYDHGVVCIGFDTVKCE